MPNLLDTPLHPDDDMLESHQHMLNHHNNHDTPHSTDAHNHDLDIAHFHNNLSPNMPVSINGQQNLYYSPYQDNPCNVFPDSLPLSYSYPLQDGQLDFQYILGQDMSPQQQHHPHPHHNSNNHSINHPQLDSQNIPHPGVYPPLRRPDDDRTIHSSPSSSSSLGHAPIMVAHTLLPPVMSSSSPTSSPKVGNINRTPSKRDNEQPPPQTDPYAAAFLQDQLGKAKWETFSARLFERRLGPTKSRARTKLKGVDGESSSSGGATAIDFLVKVEVVKEVLRTYVPHPYNPLKSLTHPYVSAPSGFVTLTRSTVLMLSGWSNTQFSYWARRSEGVSVLGSHDDRLHAVAIALDRRLKEGGTISSPDDPDSHFRSTSTDDAAAGVTGKGLDLIIEEVKKRTGLSPFIRGKHSSLDPFGTTTSDKETASGSPQGAPTAVYMPTFQAMQYSHPSSPGSPSLHRAPRKGRRPSNADSLVSLDAISVNSDPVHHDDEQTPRLEYVLSKSRVNSPLPDGTSPEAHHLTSSGFIPAPPPHLRPRGIAAMDNALSDSAAMAGLIRTYDDESREAFPVSDSRSDFDSMHRKRPRGLEEATAEKRFRLGSS